MDNQLSIIVSQSGIEEKEGLSILERFGAYEEIAKDWENKAKAIVVTDATQTAEMKMAREGRLFLAQKRIAIEKARKELKEQSLRKGQAIDSIARFLTSLIEPTEKYLKEQEDFVKIQAEKEVERLRLEAEKKAEEERLKKEKEDREEQERIRKENEKLRKEAEERERVLAEERRKAEEEKAKQEAILRKEREERERVENELKLQKEKEEQEKKQKELELERARQLEEEAKKQESLKPEREKLAKYIETLLSVERPELSDVVLRDHLNSIVDFLNDQVII